MESKRKDLEIVYHLQWKNNGDNKMSSSIVGMYDIPSTTLNWDTFKSYLLKNSGTAGDDVKVSYIIDDKEFSIESQIDFQIALYSFRNRARMGEIINLKLDRIASKKSYKSDCVNAHTQVDPEMNHPQSTVCPPDWFRTYMKQFKKEVVEEVTMNVVSAISKQTNTQNLRKIKMEPTKRTRKHGGLHMTDNGNEKELLKSFKLEKKLENKLEKLEHKTLKIKEKKQALSAQHQKSPQAVPLDESDFEMDAVPSSLNNVQHVSGGVLYAHTWKIINNGNKQWDSNTELRYAWGSQSLIPVNKTVSCPVLKPREEGTITVVLNTPTTPGHYECYWHFYHSNRRFGHWLGCQVIVDEEPFDLTISGPNKSNNEMFYSYVKTTSDLAGLEDVQKDDSAKETVLNTNVDVKDEPKVNDLQCDYAKQNDIKSSGDNCSSDSDNQSLLSFEDSNSSVSTVAYDEFVLVPTLTKTTEKTAPPDDDKPNNTEPTQSVQSEEAAGSSKESDDNNNNTDTFVVVNSSESSIGKITEHPSTDEVGVKVEDAKKTDEDAIEKKPSGYAFVVYKGLRLPVPKKFLHADYLATAEDAPNPKEMSDSTQQLLKQEVKSLPEKSIECEAPRKEMTFILGSDKQDAATTLKSMCDYTNAEAVSYASHCSATGSCFSDNYNNVIANENDTPMTNSRLFVFPSNCPGFEVVHPQTKSCDQCSTNDKMSASVNTTSMTAFYNNPPLTNSVTFPSPPQNHISYTVPLPQNQQNHSSYTVPLPNQIHSSYTVQQNPLHLSYTIPRNARGDEGYQSIPGNCQSSCSNHNLQEIVKAEQCTASGCTSPTPHVINGDRVNTDQSTVHILPETLVTGAVNVASSAINTARSVLNMIVPTRNEPGVWVNGHWVAANPESPREAALRTLSEMGFWDRDLNATLLARYNDDLARVVTELVK